MKKNQLKNIITSGVITENPTFRMALGMCPTLAVTTTILNGIGMGLATLLVIVLSNFFLSMLKRFISETIRIPAYIIVIATLATIAEMLMKKFTPSLYDSLGIFIPLIVVNCIVFGRAESFASKNPVFHSVIDGISTGAGFTLSLTLLGGIRELFGSGSLFGVQVLGSWYTPLSILVMPAGGFLALSLLMALFNYLYNKMTQDKKTKITGKKINSNDKTSEVTA